MDNDLRSRITAVFSDVYKAHAQTASSPALSDESVLMAVGLDSLGFAVLVFQLEEELGYDPFTLSESAYYPRTFGEFVRFYEENGPC